MSSISPAVRLAPRSGARSAASRPLSICLISEEFPPETGWGGIGTYSYNLSRGLTRLGHRVHVVARCWGEDRIEQIEGVTVHRIALPEPCWRRGTWFVHINFWETRQVLLWMWRAARRIRQISETERIDVVETPEYHAQGLIESMSDRRPMIVRLHTPAFLCRMMNDVATGGSRLDSAISEHLEYRLAGNADLVTSPSRDMAAQVAKPWRMSDDDIRVIPNPIDEDLFDLPDDECGDGRTILFVGRLERRKGVETLAEALPAVLRSCPEARVRFVGSDHPSGPGGSMVKHVRRVLQDAGVSQDRVEFTGAVDRTQLPRMYRQAAVCVVPSLYESFGYTCVEAMASGAAVVASDAGALPEIITHGHDGLLFPVRDSTMLAQAIVHLLKDPPLRQRLGAEARRTVRKRFSCDAVCRQTIEAYRSVLHL